MGLKRVLAVSIGLRICVLVIAIGFVCFRYVWGGKIESIPIIKASSEGNIGQVQVLLDKGEYASQQDPDGNTPLHFCVYNGRYENNRKVLQMLILHQADVRARNNAGQSPAHLIGHIDEDVHRMKVLEWLIKFGYNIDTEDIQGYTVLDKITEQYDLTGVQLLLSWWGSLITPEMIDRARKKAEKDGYRDVVALLKQKIVVLGADGNIDAWDKQVGLNGLHYAVIRGDVATVVKLLDRGAKINAVSKDEFQFAPLHLAVLHQKDGIVSLLMERGAAVDVADVYGNTPAHLVAFIHNDAMAKKLTDLLLKKGAPGNAKNKNGDTLLHTLIRINNIELLSFIVKEYTLDKKIKDANFETPLDLAQRLNRTEIVKLLR